MVECQKGWFLMIFVGDAPQYPVERHSVGRRRCQRHVFDRMGQFTERLPDVLLQRHDAVRLYLFSYRA